MKIYTQTFQLIDVLWVCNSCDRDVLELYFGKASVNLSVVGGTTHVYTNGCIKEVGNEVDVAVYSAVVVI